ncbi:hypothetical protein OHA04_40185 (plasmid) [Streptomyces sp. NBC_01590]
MGADRGGRARHELAAAIAALFELPPPLDSDADEAWRSMLGSRFGTVRPFLKLLVAFVDFGTTPEGLPVLTALKSLPDLMGRKKAGPAEIDTGRAGSWRRLVLSAPHLEPGTVDWKTYTFCVLEQFHRMLRSKQVFAKNSSASATGTRRNAGHLPPFRGAASHAIDPEPWGPPYVVQEAQKNPKPAQSRGPRICWEEGFVISAGGRKTVLVHPDDAAGLQPLPNWENSTGCCGPTGDEGLNRACPCGAPVATLAADCFGPYELHLAPVRTYAFSQ